MKKKITLRVISALSPHLAEETWVWDDELRRFAFRLKPSGVGTYLIVYRNQQQRQRQMLVGRQGIIAPEQARAVARKLLAEVDAGRDPSESREADRTALTVEALCSIYMDAARAGLVTTRFGRPKKASTLAIDAGRVTRHIVPLIGQKLARDLRRSDIQRMVDAISQGKTASTQKTKARGVARVTGGAGTAARVVELFGGIWSWASKRDLVGAISPVNGVDKRKGQAKDRVLSMNELARLGIELSKHSEQLPTAATALQLIAVTGMRRQEACGLKWSEIDFDACCIRLTDSKTGRSMRPIGAPACELLKNLRQVGEYVFPSRSGGKAADLKKSIAGFFKSAGLDDARSHDLRRTFATTAASLGYGDATIGEMLGHARRGVTERHYVRRPDAAILSAVTNVALEINKALNQNSATRELTLS